MKNITVTTSNTVALTAQVEDSDMIPGTGWSYSDAASMKKECEREDRLFGRRNRNTSSQRPRMNAAQRAARYAARFLAQTGWTLEAAASAHKEALRDRRLFGGPAMYAAS
jgi:hypothetical protein